MIGLRALPLLIGSKNLKSLVTYIKTSKYKEGGFTGIALSEYRIRDERQKEMVTFQLLLILSDHSVQKDSNQSFRNRSMLRDSEENVLGSPLSRSHSSVACFSFPTEIQPTSDGRVYN